MSALPPKADTRIGTFGQTGALGDLIHRPLPALLSLFQGLRGKGAIVGDRYERGCATASAQGSSPLWRARVLRPTEAQTGRAPS